MVGFYLFGGFLTRVLLFVDYQNAYNLAREAFGDKVNDPPAVGNIYPQRLGLLVRDLGAKVDPERALEGVRIYRGEPGAKSHAMTQAAFQHQKATWERYDCNKIISRPLKYAPETSDEKGRAADGRLVKRVLTS